MHILLIPSDYPSKLNLRAGIYVHDQAQALHRAGHQIGVLVEPRLPVTLAHLRRGGAVRAITVEDYLPEFSVYRMHLGWTPRVLPLLHAALVSLVGRAAYRRYCQEHGQPDIIHAHNVFYGGLLAARIRDRWPVPVVLTEHSSSYGKGLIFLPGQHIVARYTLRHVDKVLTVGPGLVAALGRYMDSTAIEIIENMVDVDFFSPVPWSDSAFTFVMAGNLNKNKAQHIALEAFEQAFHGQNVRLILAGDGDQRSALEAFVMAKGLQDQVKFVGWLNRDGLRDLLRHSHAVVSPSRVETFGLTLAEAMACGKPVISTRSGGPESFVNADNGLLVPPDDAGAMAAAMQQMIERYDRYSPDAIRAACVRRFSTETVVRHLETVYRGAMQ